MKLKSFISKILISLIIVLVILIGSKKSTSFKQFIYKNVYDNTISFAYLNTLYNKYLGSILPFKLDIGVTPVFSETLKYKNKATYLDGVMLEVDSNYLVPAINSGLVIFVGEKEGYGNTIVVLGEDGVEVWYSNINNTVTLYDYITSGTYIGDTIGDKLYLTFKQDGNILNYEEYIS
ncbi:MAG: M23 family metallopeptidase [Bacilli bacterium]|nr:M23 family metallopeptidase [Bacilli bacterium]